MLAYKIVRHSALLVISNFGEVLKIFWVYIAIFTAAQLASLYWLVKTLSTGQVGDNSLLALSLFLTVCLLSVFVAGWSAVRWHRYILLNENQGFWGSLHAGHVWRYLVGGLWIALASILICTGAVIGYWLVISNIVTAITSSAIISSLILVISGLALFLGVFIFSLRYGAVLPGIAVGHLKTVREHWHATNGHNRTVALVVIFELLLFAVISIPAELIRFLTLPGWLSITLYLVLSTSQVIFVTATQFSILTTLYGYFFEHRELN